MSRTVRGRWQTGSQRTRILRKIAVALAIGTLAYLITNMLADTDAEPKLIGLTLSVFIGGVTFVTQMLVDFEGRLLEVEDAQQRHLERVDNTVRRGFAKVGEASALFDLLQASDLRTDTVIELVRHATRLEPSPDLTFRFAQGEISRMAQFMKELCEGGNVTYDGEDRDWLLSLARHVRSTLDATSLTTVDAGGNESVDEGLWHSDLGQRYLYEQRNALTRGVKIRRVFIVDRPGVADDPGFLAVCEVQRKAGIQVRIFDSSGVAGVRRSSLFDFVLFDDVISYEVRQATRLAATHPPSIVHTRLELRPELVRDRRGRFEELWALARELRAPLAVDGDQPTNT